MKTPRDLHGSELVKLLERLDYFFDHQTGSHIIIKTDRCGENSQSIPKHKPLKVGTLDDILGEVADHFNMTKKDLMDLLFNKKSRVVIPGC